MCVCVYMCGACMYVWVHVLLNESVGQSVVGLWVSTVKRTLWVSNKSSLRKTLKKRLLENIFSYYNFFYWYSPILLLKTTATALQTLSQSHFTEISLILPETVAPRSSVKKEFKIPWYMFGRVHSGQKGLIKPFILDTLL